MQLKNSRLTNTVIVFLILLSLLAYAALTLCRPAAYGLQGKYYDNPEWGGDPHTTSLDPELSTDTLHIRQRDHFPDNRFSVEWTGYIGIPETGTYVFSIHSDDGSWMFIDENPVFDDPSPHGLLQKEGKIHLIKGLHEIKIRYLQVGGQAMLNVSWTRESFSLSPLQAFSLLPPTTNTASFWIYQQGKGSCHFSRFSGECSSLGSGSLPFELSENSEKTCSNGIFILLRCSEPEFPIRCTAFVFNHSRLPFIRLKNPTSFIGSLWLCIPRSSFSRFRMPECFQTT